MRRVAAAKLRRKSVVTWMNIAMKRTSAHEKANHDGPVAIMLVRNARKNPRIH